MKSDKEIKKKTLGNKSHIVTISFSIALIIAVFTGFYVCLSEIGPDGYIELENLADKLNKGGHPELKAEIKELIKTQGFIKGHQYLRSLQNYRNIGKDLDLQEAKKRVAS